MQQTDADSPLGEQFAQAAKNTDMDEMAAVMAVLKDDIERYARALIPVALRHLLDANDVFQDAAIRIFKAAPQFKYTSEDNFRHWLLAIVRTTVLDQVKRYTSQKRSEHKRAKPLSDDSQSITRLMRAIKSDQSTPSSVIANEEICEVMTEYIDQLKPDYHAVVVMKYYQELTNEQIAKLLGRSPEAVRKLLTRALKVLREHVGDQLS